MILHVKSFTVGQNRQSWFLDKSPPFSEVADLDKAGFPFLLTPVFQVLAFQQWLRKPSFSVLLPA